jgi:hypothetical protein
VRGASACPAPALVAGARTAPVPRPQPLAPPAPGPSCMRCERRREPRGGRGSARFVWGLGVWGRVRPPHQVNMCALAHNIHCPAAPDICRANALQNTAGCINITNTDYQYRFGPPRGSNSSIPAFKPIPYLRTVSSGGKSRATRRCRRRASHRSSPEASPWRSLV